MGRLAHAVAHHAFDVIINRVREHHLVIVSDLVCAECVGQIVHFLSLFERQLDVRDDLRIVLEQLGRVERTAACTDVGLLQKFGTAPDGRAHAVQVGRLVGGRLHFAGDRLEQCVHAQTASCRDRIDRHAQTLAQLAAVDMNIL